MTVETLYIGTGEVWECREDGHRVTVLGVKASVTVVREASITRTSALILFARRRRRGASGEQTLEGAEFVRVYRPLLQ